MRARWGGIWLAPVVLMACALAFSSCISSAREPDFYVSGIVRDARTGAPLPGVFVSDGAYGSRPARGATSGPDGVYGYFTWYEEHAINAEAQGYARSSRLLLTRFFGRSPVAKLDFVLEPLD